MEMKIYIEGKEFTKAECDAWKRKRAKKVFRILKKQMPKESDADHLCELLTEWKLHMSYEDIVSCIHIRLAVGSIAMKLAALCSGKRRSKAITTIYADGIRAETLHPIIEALMLQDNEVHRRVNVGAYPDHYALIPRNDTLEVIETTGTAPVPTQFFITFHEESGIQEPRDASYPFQSVGVAKLKDGTLIGGVRHQFKNTETGIEVRTLVEFPGICPRMIVKAHQKHLAVEWSNWIRWAKEQQREYTEYEEEHCANG